MGEGGTTAFNQSGGSTTTDYLHIGSAGTQAIVGSAGIAGPPICWTQACPAGHAQASVPSGTHLHSIASQ